MNIIAYKYKGAIHCVDCTKKALGDDDLGYMFTMVDDSLVNPVHEFQVKDKKQVCGDCLEIIQQGVNDA